MVVLHRLYSVGVPSNPTFVCVSYSKPRVRSHLVTLNDPGLTTSAFNDVLGSNVACSARCDEAMPAAFVLGLHVEQPFGTALSIA